MPMRLWNYLCAAFAPRKRRYQVIFIYFGEHCISIGSTLVTMPYSLMAESLQGIHDKLSETYNSKVLFILNVIPLGDA